jgi:tetratricopeptide (TPR) repeat protein
VAVGAQVEGGGSAGATGDVAEALDAVLASEPFQRSPRSRDFLAYVVHETLAGRAAQLSERTVGRFALGRGPDFDGSTDSLVRVTGTRVRKALAAYYAGDGAHDVVRIVLPAGSYTPVVDRGGVPLREAGPYPGVGVLQPEVVGDERAHAVAAALADALVVSLSQHDTLRVVGPAAAQADSAEWARRIGVSHVLDGRIVAKDGPAHIAVRLVSARDAEVVWSEPLEISLDGADLLESVERWGRGLASRAAAIGGVVLAEAAPSTSPELRARSAYYHYLARGTKDATLEAIDALDEALEIGPRTAPLLAMRGAVANAVVLQGIGDRHADTDLAERLAREALALDAGSAHAYLVLAGAARTRGQWSVCQQHARRAAHLAPHHPPFLVSAGFLIEATGEWEEGMAIIDEAFDLDPRLPVYVRLYLAMGNVVLGDYERSLAEARLIDVDGEVFGPFYRALALSGLGDLDAAHREVERMLEIEPEALELTPGKLREGFNLSEKQLADILALLERASRPGAGSARAT